MVYFTVMSMVGCLLLCDEMERSWKAVSATCSKTLNTQLAGSTEKKHSKISHRHVSHFLRHHPRLLRYRQDNVDCIWSSSGIQPAFCLGEMTNLFSRQSGKKVKIKHKLCLALRSMLLGPWKQLLQQETETET